MANDKQMHFLVAGLFDMVSGSVTEVAFDHAHGCRDLLELAIAIVVEVHGHFALIFFCGSTFRGQPTLGGMTVFMP